MIVWRRCTSIKAGFQGIRGDIDAWQRWPSSDSASWVIPWRGIWPEGRARGDGLQPHRRKAETWVREYGGAAPRRRRPRPRRRRLRVHLRGQRRRPARGGARARGRLRGHDARAPSSSINTTASADRGARAPRRRASARAWPSSMLRSPAVRPGPRTASSRSWCGGDAAAFERASRSWRRSPRRSRLMGPAGRRAS